jgi:hypothetical protein
MCYRYLTRLACFSVVEYELTMMVHVHARGKMHIIMVCMQGREMGKHKEDRELVKTVRLVRMDSKGILRLAGNTYGGRLHRSRASA